MFSEQNPQKRGKLLENVLCNYFKTYDILVRMPTLAKLLDASFNGEKSREECVGKNVVFFYLIIRNIL